MEGLETDGLDLNVVEQMRGLALKETETDEPDVDRSSNVFEPSFPSTKVSIARACEFCFSFWCSHQDISTVCLLCRRSPLF